MSDVIPTSPTPSTPPPPPPPPGSASMREAQHSPPVYPRTAPQPAYEYTGPAQGFQQTDHGPSYTAGPPPHFAGDNTGVPASAFGPAKQIGTTLFKSLFDVKFHTFITRRLAPVIYVIGLVAIGLGAVITLFGGLAAAFAAMGSSYTSAMGVIMMFGSIIGVPLGALVFVIVLRVGIEAVVALVAVAENTGRTALNTDSKKQ